MKDNKYRVTSFRDEIFIDEENIEEVIYRLNTKYEMMNELYEDSEEEIERLHSIIKEVRAKLYDLNYKIKEIHNVPFDISEIFEMIEILDKENNND